MLLAMTGNCFRNGDCNCCDSNSDAYIPDPWEVPDRQLICRDRLHQNALVTSFLIALYGLLGLLVFL